MLKRYIKNTYVVLVFLLLTLNIFHTFSSAFIVDFEQVNVSWDIPSNTWQVFAI